MQGCVLGFDRSRGEGAVLRVGTCSMEYHPQLKFFLHGPVVRKCCRGKVEWRWWESGGNLNWGWALARWVTTPGGEQVEPRVRFTQGCTWYQDEYPRLVGGHNVDRACREVVGWGSGRSFGVARGVASGQKLAIGAHCWVCRGWVGESVQGPVVRSVVGR